MGDEILPSSKGIIISQYKDPVMNQSVYYFYNGMSVNLGHFWGIVSLLAHLGKNDPKQKSWGDSLSVSPMHQIRAFLTEVSSDLYGWKFDLRTVPTAAGFRLPDVIRCYTRLP